MSDKHPAEALADCQLRPATWDAMADHMLRRIPALEAEIARLRAALDDAQAGESVAQAAAEALRADAERYLWLCDAPGDWSVCVWEHDDRAWARDSRGHAVISAAIDAAREAK